MILLLVLALCSSLLAFLLMLPRGVAAAACIFSVIATILCSQQCHAVQALSLSLPMPPPGADMCPVATRVY